MPSSSAAIERHRGARAADIDRADRNDSGAVGIDVDASAGLAAEIEPEAASHAASLVLLERRLHMRMVLRRFERRADADRTIDRAIGRLGAFLGGVLDAEVDRIHADLVGDLVDDAFDREGRHRRRGCAIGRDLRTVDQHFIADRLDVLQVIAGIRTSWRRVRPTCRRRGRPA